MIELTVIALIVALAAVYSYRKLRLEVRPGNPCGCDHAEGCELTRVLKKGRKNF
ncbi:MAG: hypothetical protein V1794_11430 [Candidatus Glassbacteria bacterium]